MRTEIKWTGFLNWLVRIAFMDDVALILFRFLLLHKTNHLDWYIRLKIFSFCLLTVNVFSSFFSISETYTEELLKVHENELEEVSSYYNTYRNLFDKLVKWEALFQERVDIEVCFHFFISPLYYSDIRLYDDSSLYATLSFIWIVTGPFQHRNLFFLQELSGYLCLVTRNFSLSNSTYLGRFIVGLGRMKYRPLTTWHPKSFGSAGVSCQNTQWLPNVHVARYKLLHGAFVKNNTFFHSVRV